jgi:hypothetical protein
MGRSMKYDAGEVSLAVKNKAYLVASAAFDSDGGPVQISFSAALSGTKDIVAKFEVRRNATVIYAGGDISFSGLGSLPSFMVLDSTPGIGKVTYSVTVANARNAGGVCANRALALHWGE